MKWYRGAGAGILIFFIVHPLLASEMLKTSRCVKGSLLMEHRLENEYVVDEFHVFYSLQGKDALTYVQDSNGEGVPDVIKDIGIQLKAAKYLYSSLSGLQFPLNQKIFSQARQINVYLLLLPKGNGLAFDRVASETMNDGMQIPCGLKIVLNAALRPAQNITPAHELFHLYQYGYAVFKQKWYLEGMARWMEDTFKPVEKRTRSLAALPACESNFSRGYGAANYWANYAQRSFASVSLPEKANTYRYQDGSPVFKANVLPGGGMLEPLFHQLSLYSVEASRAENMANIRWPEEKQQSPRFNTFICQALLASGGDKK